MPDDQIVRKLRAPLLVCLLAIPFAVLIWNRRADLDTGTLPEAFVEQSTAPPDPRRVAPPVSTPPEIVDRMLSLARVTADDLVYDLGSGDGRIVIAAAQRFGARGVGIDIDERQIEQAQTAALQAGVERLVLFRRDNALAVDLSPATVVTLFLGSAANQALRPRFEKQLRPGARVVSLFFKMGNWEPTRTEPVEDKEGVTRNIYLWEIAQAANGVSAAPR